MEETKSPIPLEMARDLCAGIRRVKAKKPFTQCRGCVRVTKGAEDKMCFYKPPDFRGCALVNDGSTRESERGSCGAAGSGEQAAGIAPLPAAYSPLPHRSLLPAA
jgi:hypothetical protein